MTPFDAAQLTPATLTGLSSSAALGAERTVQQTLAGEVVCGGIGVHSGQKVTMRLLPSEANTGIAFIRTDLLNGARRVEARWDNVVDTRMCTVIANKAGSRVATIEHLMAALSAYGVDNAVIEIDGAEVPVMDGSSDAFVELIEQAGVAPQKTPRKMIEILSPIEVTQDGKYAKLLPAIEQRFSCEIDFDSAAISRQSYELTLSPSGFKSEIGRARTFGFFEEVDQMRKLGLARGGSLDNAVVIKDDQVMNEGGLRFDDEFVRHKLLDAVGDMALAGAAIRGHFDAYCPGHALNNRLLRALFADDAAWRYVTAGEAV